MQIFEKNEWKVTNIMVSFFNTDLKEKKFDAATIYNYHWSILLLFLIPKLQLIQIKTEFIDSLKKWNVNKILQAISRKFIEAAF